MKYFPLWRTVHQFRIFRIFFGDEIFQIMWDETKLYTTQQIDNKEQNNEEGEKRSVFAQ
jgi:hypothetical protein